MKSKKETDYRTVDPQAVYELKKVALRLRRKGKEVKEICEVTGLADKTVEWLSMHMTTVSFSLKGFDNVPHTRSVPVPDLCGGCPMRRRLHKHRHFAFRI